MAKPHRMFVLTVASLVAAVESLFGLVGYALPLGLVVIVIGSGVTVVRRIRRVAFELESR
jgi:hypothetical protein